uniref:NADH-ubiquinone oxidoreductase chain 4 n=1 Tax=Heterostelium pallidum TaxID=13642 RepID=Q5ILJ4_HETPA|nr:NADH dehydrogenase subunit 4 [Heterostelium pallidum]AAU00616.1 NADH dehydrogenase subunit 4 [Heterostelium pallidum]
MNKTNIKLIIENNRKILSVLSLIIGTFIFINVSEDLGFINVLNIYNISIILIISILCLIPEYKIEELKLLTYWFSVGLVILSTIFTFMYNGFSQVEKVNTYLNSEYLYTNILNINIGYGVDGISMIFIWLTTILIMSCILISWNVIKTDIKFYLVNLLIIELLLINFFVVMDLVHFYIIYESILIPIVIMISMWGSREEKKLAAYQIFVYTLIGSIFMLASIGYLYYSLGTTDYFLIKELLPLIPEFMQKLIFLGFFIGFAVKIPIVPLHLWLLRAHVEAPTAGSVLLAGILLKLGGYGFLRFNIGLLPEMCTYFFPLIVGLSLISILYTGIATVMQLDVKRIIAYSSISHMNVVVLGLFSQVLQGIEGGIYLMVSHGLVSGGLFLCIGVLYEQYKSRLLYSYNNVVHVMPIFAIIFFILTLANIAFPITSSFIGELLIFCGIIKKNIVVAFFGALGMIVTVIYSFWLYNRIFFDNGMLTSSVKYFNKSGEKYRDINNRELLSIGIMILFVFIFGIKPNLILNLIENNSINLI